jgi:hypothetical protein
MIIETNNKKYLITRLTTMENRPLENKVLISELTYIGLDPSLDLFEPLFVMEEKGYCDTCEAIYYYETGKLTLYDLFADNNSFFADIEINKRCSLFIENLDKNGGGQVEEFDKSLLTNNLLIELQTLNNYGEFEYETTIDELDHNITLNTTIKELRKIARQYC